MAKASMIWIIGEYADRIDNADELLDTFLETFEEEDPAVQLQLLTATVKCFLKNPEDTQDMVQKVLDMATEESDNPDLRDRGFIYWRLLSTDPEAAKVVVLGEKPVIEDDTFNLDPQLLNNLIGQIATLSSIYHKPPEAFVTRPHAGMSEGIHDDDDDDEEDEYEDENEEEEKGGDGGVDLLDMGGLSVSKQPSSTGPSALEQDLFGGKSTQNETSVRMTKVCTADKSGGIEIHAGFRQVNNEPKMELEFRNVSSAVPISSLAIQLNKNSFGLSPASQQIVCAPPIPQGGVGKNTVDLVISPAMLIAAPAGQPASPQVQVAIKNMATGTVFYFAVSFNFEALFSSDGALDRTSFIDSWKSIDDRKELYSTVSDLPSSSTTIDQVIAKFSNHNIFFIARRPVPTAADQEVVYFSMKTTRTGMQFLAELTFKQNVNACKLCLKTESIAYGMVAKVALENLLRN